MACLKKTVTLTNLPDSSPAILLILLFLWEDGQTLHFFSMHSLSPPDSSPPPPYLPLVTTWIRCFSNPSAGWQTHKRDMFVTVLQTCKQSPCCRQGILSLSNIISLHAVREGGWKMFSAEIHNSPVSPSHCRWAFKNGNVVTFWFMRCCITPTCQTWKPNP